MDNKIYTAEHILDHLGMEPYKFKEVGCSVFDIVRWLFNDSCFVGYRGTGRTTLMALVAMEYAM